MSALSEEIVRLVKEGVADFRIARQLGCTKTYVRHVRSRAQLPQPKGPPTDKGAYMRDYSRRVYNLLTPLERSAIRRKAYHEARHAGMTIKQARSKANGALMSAACARQRAIARGETT